MLEETQNQELLRISNFPRYGSGANLADLLAEIAGREFRRSGQRRSVYQEFADYMTAAVTSRFPACQLRLPALAVAQAFVLARAGGTNRAQKEELRGMCESLVYSDTR